MAHLFIIDSEGRQEQTAEQICKLFGVDYKKIIKNPLFKSNKKKRGNNYFGSRAGNHILPYFKAKHPVTNIEVEVRYVESWVNDSQNKNIYKYEPRRVHFYGDTFTADDNEELAVWFYLNKKFKEKVPYEFVDRIADAQKELNRTDDVERALILARKIEGSKMEVLLKGLVRMTKMSVGSIEDMDEVEQRSIFRTIALNHPALFIDSVEKSPNAAVEGAILQLIDKRGIVLLPDGPYRVWKWGIGNRSGQVIGSPIKDMGSDPVSLLITEIVSNPSEYKDDLILALERANADNATEKMSKEWDGFNLNSTVESISSIVTNQDFENDPNKSQVDVSELVMLVPENSMEAIREFCEKHGYGKGAPEVALMKRSIEEGIVTQDNIELWCSKNMKTK